MKTKGIIFLILSVVLFFFTNKIRNKEIDKLTISGADGISIMSITPFNNEKNEAMYEYMTYMGRFTGSDDMKSSIDKIKGKVALYQGATFIAGFLAVAFLIAGLYYIFRKMKKQTVSETNEESKHLTIIKAEKSDEIKPEEFCRFSVHSPNNKITQVVFKVPVSSVIETEFSSLMLPYDKFPIVSSQPWCSGLIVMAGKPAPYHLVRVGDFAEEVKACDLTVAFSFCKLSASGLFLMDTRIESEDLTDDIREKYSVVPPVPKPIVEWIVSANDPFSMKMLKDAIEQEKYHMIVAKDSDGMVNEVFMPDGSSMESVAPEAHHDRVIGFDKDLREALQKEYADLMAHHNSIPSYKRDFNQAMQELGELMPLDKDPVFEE